MLMLPITRLFIRSGKSSILPTTRRRIASAASVVLREHPHHDQLPSQYPPSSRRDGIKNAKPFSAFLTDTFQRQHDYLRISLTEKCNLRCLYCMPEDGVPQSPPAELLTSPEIFMLSSLFVSQGVTKIRLTGGEPTVRRDIVPLMHKIGSLRSQGLQELCITTNGVSLHRKLDSMAEAGLTGVNLSLDTLDPWQFQIMTRRKGFEAVMKSINQILAMNKLGAGIKLKINCVVMRGMNEREIIPFVEMGREKEIEVRFIEYMPFDGNKWSQGKMLSFEEMLNIIREKYPTLRKVQDHKNDTSKTYEIPGFVGRIGFITSMTHNFCGSCNRLRITSDGNLKVCLFGNAEVSLRDILRQSNDGHPIDEEAFEAMQQIETAHRQRAISFSTPLGGSQSEQELLKVIGSAVSKKAEKHAGMADLKNMKNRPMILIGITWSAFCNIYPMYLGDPKEMHQSEYRSQPASKAPLRRSHHPLVTRSFPFHHLPSSSMLGTTPIRKYSTKATTPPIPSQRLTHLTPSGEAHMVSISSKAPTVRLAIAVCTLHFSNPTAILLIRSNAMKKGDVLSTARIAGIMAAKKTSDLIPLCHPISISHISVELHTFGGDIASSDGATGSGNDNGRVEIKATVTCEGKTGVEMEALAAASVTGLTVYDMCKAVDKGMRIEGLRVVRKEGGKSGVWIEGDKVDAG